MYRLLNEIKSHGDFAYQELLEIIDIKTESRWKHLDNSFFKAHRNTIENSIESTMALRSNCNPYKIANYSSFNLITISLPITYKIPESGH
jgi:sarcosine oxidase delta subunit